MTRNFAVSLAILATLMMGAVGARAQSAAQGQTSTVNGQSAAIISPGAINVNSFGAAQLPSTEVRQDFHTNQAASAPANIGGVAGAQLGCPAVDGWSASVVVANGGKTTAKELPSCMYNIFAMVIVPSLNIDDKGMFDWKSVAKLEALCLGMYKDAIEGGLPFKCKATREAEKRDAVATFTQTPGVVTATNTNDDIIRNRLNHAPY